MMILRERRERTRLFRFAVVGSIGALVDFLVFNLLRGVLGVFPVTASVISFIIAVSSNFIWNKVWTYPDSRTKALPRQLLEFALVNVIGLGIRTPVFVLLQEPLFSVFERGPALMAVRAEWLGHNIALACAIGLVMFWNFYVNRFWTFADVD